MSFREQANCVWCGRTFRARGTGGSAQKFCSAGHPQAFWIAARRWTMRAIEAGLLSVECLKPTKASVHAARDRVSSGPTSLASTLAPLSVKKSLIQRKGPQTAGLIGDRALRISGSIPVDQLRECFHNDGGAACCTAPDCRDPPRLWAADAETSS
jgi:hypothetical protein